MKLDFGDGNSQELDGALPLTARHTYALAGQVRGGRESDYWCGGRHTASSIVGAAVAPRVDRVTIDLDRSAGPGVREIRVEGAGRCAYTLDYGDGNSEGRNADLPEVVRHNYPAEGRYTVVVGGRVSPAAKPRAGGSRATFVVRTPGSDGGNWRGVGGLIEPDRRHAPDKGGPARRRPGLVERLEPHSVRLRLAPLGAGHVLEHALSVEQQPLGVSVPCR